MTQLLEVLAAAVLSVGGLIGAIATIVRYIVRPVQDAVASGRELVDELHEARENLRDLTATFLRVVSDDDARFRRLEERVGVDPRNRRTRRSDAQAP